MNDSNSKTSNELLSPEVVQASGQVIERLLDGLRSVILGQEELLQLVVTCLLAKGHMLLEGLPGLGKTELVKALAALLGMDFRRVQFTPDLLPGDILGSPILQDAEDGRRFVFHKGPIFANLLLADEINRATPKTQAALLEAMQERRVTVLGETHQLPQPFLVLATQNPIELEGTYPLPEAQLDRFTFKIDVLGVSAETLQQIISTRHHGQPPQLAVAVETNELNSLIDNVNKVYLPEGVANWIARLCAATQPNDDAPEIVSKYVRFGASPRAAIAIADTSRAAALIAGKPNVGFDEVRKVVHSVLGHRVILDYAARMEGYTTRTVVDQLMQDIPEIGTQTSV